MDDVLCAVCGSPAGGADVPLTEGEGRTYCSADCMVKALNPEQLGRLAKLLGPIRRPGKGEP